MPNIQENPEANLRVFTNGAAGEAITAESPESSARRFIVGIKSGLCRAYIIPRDHGWKAIDVSRCRNR
jgi:hypothetical protein